MNSMDEGKQCYLKDSTTHAWFSDQWQAWPERVNEQFTTNISFLYGGVLAYRELFDKEPILSKEFIVHVNYFDAK